MCLLFALALLPTTMISLFFLVITAITVRGQLDTLPLSECGNVKMCNGHGDCVAKNICSCFVGWYEDTVDGCLERGVMTDAPTFMRAPTPMATPAPVAVIVPGSDDTTVSLAASGFVWDDTTVTLVAIGGVIVFLVLTLVVVGCLICRLKPDSSFANKYRASVARVSQYGDNKKRSHNRANALPDDVSVDGNPMFQQNFRTANDLKTLMRADSGQFGQTHAFVAAMHFGTAPTFETQRPANNMYQKVPPAPNGVNPHAVALWDFIGTQPGDLTFRAGDRIELLQSSKNWWYGRLRGREGTFPSNYTQLVAAAPSDSSSPAIATAAFKALPAKPELLKTTTQVNHLRASLHQGQQYSLRSHQQQQKQPLHQQQKQQPPSQLHASQADDGIARRAVALYDFPGEQPGDLELRKGDVIDLIDWSTDWYTGMTADGRVGVVSRNFLALLTPL
jgi:hypothetical protein